MCKLPLFFLLPYPTELVAILPGGGIVRHRTIMNWGDKRDMSFSASHIEIALKYTNQGQNCLTVRCYTWDGVAIATASPAALGEAWWNHYKDAWRALAPDNGIDAVFQSVNVREVGGGLAYGEFAIPSGEQDGTRSSVGLGAQLPSYCAVGCRFTVSSGVTRPGQMRIPFLNEIDNAGNIVDSAFIALCEDLAALYSSPNTLGAPTATGVITPTVVRFGIDNNTVAASQPIDSYVLNSFITSQVSRRRGHGS